MEHWFQYWTGHSWLAANKCQPLNRLYLRCMLPVHLPNLAPVILWQEKRVSCPDFSRESRNLGVLLCQTPKLRLSLEKSGQLMMLAIISQSGYIRNKLTEISVYY